MPTSRQREATEIEVAFDSKDLLGEGPVWRHATQELLHVDILRGLVHTWHPQTGQLASESFDGEAAAAIPCQGRSLVVAIDRQLRLVSGDGVSRTLASVEQDRPQNRFNDCRSDPQGRIWAGTMSKQRTPGTASLYRLVPGGDIELAIEGTTISNGIGWSPDGSLMYFIDSITQRIDVLDFDGSDGSVANRRPFAEIAPQDGLPDGLTVDAEGGVWVCLFGGGAIRRYGSDGTLEQHIALPVPHPTCPAFGGEDLATLFITTTRHKLSPTQLSAFPLAGSVLSLTPGVRGMKANLAGVGGLARSS